MVVLLAFTVQKFLYLSTPPGADKECDPLDPESAEESARAALPQSSLPWVQNGGTVNDASCLDETAVYGVVGISSEADVQKSLAYAREHGLKVSVAGVKHSMGGHAFAKGNVVLDMTRFSDIRLHEDRSTVTVQSGATWHDIQNVIHPKYAIHAMQSTDIFTVGGSISVNAHGMDHQAGAVENTIVSMRVMLADGSVRTLSRTNNVDMYDLVVGGYGLFGVILDAELRLAPNDLYESERRVIEYTEFPDLFEEIENDPGVGLTYTHLSTSPYGSFLREGIVYLYKKTDTTVVENEIPPLGEISMVRLRRFVMNVSKYGGVFQSLRWLSEKYVEPMLESCSISRNQAISSGEACLVARNEPMHDSVPYLQNSLKGETDILHEYFIPRRSITAFIDGLRDVMRENEANLLNASIRAVNRERGVLSYAPEEAFSVVLYINQSTDADGNENMRRVTSELIDLAIDLDGRFFLPYQLHYTGEQLRASYPNIEVFFALKRAYDPGELLTNTWYEKYGHML